MAGMGFDDYDDAINCALDNGFDQVWSAGFELIPTTIELIQEFEYDENGYLLTEIY